MQAAPKTRGRLLYRVILSHLLIAVPPAVLLGVLVSEINRSALKLEAQQLHLSVAARLRDRLDNVLDMDEVPIDRRKLLLRALVATNRIDHLALYGPDGNLDSVVRVNTGSNIDRSAVPESLFAEIAERGWALTDAVFAGGARGRVIVAWQRDGKTFGYLGTSVDLAPLSKASVELASRYLLDGGEIDIIDGRHRYLASSVPGRVGQTAGAGTPFQGFEDQAARNGLAALDLGQSSSFVDSNQSARLGAVVSQPDLRWIVGVSRPESVAFASLERVKQRVILMSLIAALGAGLLGLLLARQISEPIRRLIRAVRGSMRGGFHQNVAVKGSGEVAQLGVAFNEAIRELNEHRVQLRSRTQLRLRLSRFLPPTMLREIMSKELDVLSAGKQQLTTVLYADIAGGEKFGEQVPPEHLVTILGEFFAAACASVERHGGRIDRYSGDAVIGIFVPSEKNKQTSSALAAALDTLQDTRAIGERWHESAGLAVQASVGIVTGEAVLGEAPDGSGELSVVGTMVEDAAALQQNAEPGAVVVDRRTRDDLGPNFAGAQVAPRSSTLTSKELFQLLPTRIEEVAQ